MGQLLKIYLRPSSRTPVREVEQAEAVPGAGLTGDHAGSGRRQVTILSKEAWEQATAALEVALDPGHRRANLLVEGVDLRATRERVLVVGHVRIRIRGETKPCGLMDDSALGLKAALGPEWRGGAFGEVLDAGTLRVGDPAFLEHHDD